MEELREENFKLFEMVEKVDYFVDVIRVKNYNVNIYNDDYILNMKEIIIYCCIG